MTFPKSIKLAIFSKFLLTWQIESQYFDQIRSRYTHKILLITIWKGFYLAKVVWNRHFCHFVYKYTNNYIAKWFQSAVWLFEQGCEAAPRKTFDDFQIFCLKFCSNHLCLRLFQNIKTNHHSSELFNPSLVNDINHYGPHYWNTFE